MSRSGFSILALPLLALPVLLAQPTPARAIDSYAFDEKLYDAQFSPMEHSIIRIDHMSMMGVSAADSALDMITGGGPVTGGDALGGLPGGDVMSLPGMGSGPSALGDGGAGPAGGAMGAMGAAMGGTGLFSR